MNQEKNPEAESLIWLEENLSPVTILRKAPTFHLISDLLANKSSHVFI